MRTTFFIALLFACAPALIAQAPDASCCQMRIESDAASAGLLKFTITNLKQPLVVVIVNAFETGVQIKRNDGAPVDQTEHGRKMTGAERGGSRDAIILKTRESYSESLDLRQLFELKSGSYTAQLSRDVVIVGARVPLRATVQVKVP
jgi:hypothetical protein